MVRGPSECDTRWRHVANSCPSRVWSHQLARRLAGIVALGCSLLFVVVQPSVSSATEYVDGISDQSIPNWDSGFAGSYFAGFFGTTWIAGGRISLARYVVQWNAMNGSGEPYTYFRQQFTKWVEDAGGMGLTLDVSLTSYNGVYPASSTEYKERLKEILNEAKSLGHPARYVEAWNEPNNQGGYQKVSEAVTPAHFTNSAYAACEEGYGCTIIAGNVEDNTSAKAYEEEYRTNLSPVPAIWGIHPYYSVEEKTNRTTQKRLKVCRIKAWAIRSGSLRWRPASAPLPKKMKKKAKRNALSGW